MAKSRGRSRPKAKPPVRRRPARSPFDTPQDREAASLVQVLGEHFTPDQLAQMRRNLAQVQADGRIGGEAKDLIEAGYAALQEGLVSTADDAFGAALVDLALLHASPIEVRHHRRVPNSRGRKRPRARPPARRSPRPASAEHHARNDALQAAASEVLAQLPLEQVRELRENLASFTADSRLTHEAKELLERADAARATGDERTADVALDAALALPPVSFGTVDCAGGAASDLLVVELDRQLEASWDEETGAASLDVVVDRAVAVAREFAGEDDRDLRAAFAFLTDQELSDDAMRRIRAIVHDVRNRSPLEDITATEERKTAILRLFRARRAMRAAAT